MSFVTRLGNVLAVERPPEEPSWEPLWQFEPCLVLGALVTYKTLVSLAKVLHSDTANVKGRREGDTGIHSHTPYRPGWSQALTLSVSNDNIVR